MRKLKGIFCLLLCITLVACGEQTLYSNLSEQEANEMVSVLKRAGVVSGKNSDKGNTFSVVTRSEYFADAVDILKTSGYPKKNLQSLGDVFKKEGFVSSPLEERARLNFAQSQEITSTIESIDGVIVARVHLALPEEDPLSDKQKPSSASVFVKYREGIDLSQREAQIKSLLVNSIENLPYENVTVVLFPVTQRAYSSVSSSSLKFPYLIELLVGSIVFLLCLVGYLVWKTRFSKPIKPQLKPNLSVVKSPSKGDMLHDGSES